VNGLMKLVIDTNVIIRILTGDNTEQSPVSRELIYELEEENYKFVVYPIVVSECVYVLKNVYGYEREDIANALLEFFRVDCIEVEEEDVVKQALQLYSEVNVDIADALLACKAKSQQISVVTWNARDFRKLDCDFYRPDQLVYGGSDD
jgi:predicted nucleic-acid-binding protein